MEFIFSISLSSLFISSCHSLISENWNYEGPFLEQSLFNQLDPEDALHEDL